MVKGEDNFNYLKLKRALVLGKKGFQFSSGFKGTYAEALFSHRKREGNGFVFLILVRITGDFLEKNRLILFNFQYSSLIFEEH